jgi:hypothetical protein
MPDTNTSLIAMLPDFLTWQSGNELTRSACKIHVQYMYHQIKQWSKHADTDLFHSITSLPMSSQQRLLLAPRFYHLLRYSQPGADEIDSFRQVLDLEKYLCNQEGARPRGSWTALYDFYLAPEEPVAEQAPACKPSLSFRGTTFRAPMLGGIVIDAFRPFTEADFPTPLGEATNHTPEELEFITWRLEQSLDQISRISRTARSAVDALVQVISLIRAPRSVKGTQSFSNKPVIGRMGLANANSNRWSISKIADAIIHESIHALIYKLELTNSLYLDDAVEFEGLTIVSPWSGRELPLHSFVHACFVWFGLWSFWGLASPEEYKAAELRNRAARGFLTGHPLSCIPDAARDRLRPEVRQAIDRMFKQVTSVSTDEVLPSIQNYSERPPLTFTESRKHERRSA